VNADGRVTWEDVRLVVRAYVERSDDVRLDVDHDGRITHLDIVMTVRQLGRHCHRDGPASPTATPTIELD
jgi:hypothetical protein